MSFYKLTDLPFPIPTVSSGRTAVQAAPSQPSAPRTALSLYPLSGYQLNGSPFAGLCVSQIFLCTPLFRQQAEPLLPAPNPSLGGNVVVIWSGTFGGTPGPRPVTSQSKPVVATVPVAGQGSSEPSRQP
jgi:hypothetical protein